MINKGDRIAQLIMEKIAEDGAEMKQVMDLALLGTTDRGEGGFGSTG